MISEDFKPTDPPDPLEIPAAGTFQVHEIDSRLARCRLGTAEEPTVDQRPDVRVNGG
jgi:hypothetical protein